MKVNKLNKAAIKHSFFQWFEDAISIRSLLVMILLSQVLLSNAQENSRPPVWGIAKMTYYVSDFEIARKYYGDYLGLEEAFSYNSEKGQVLSYKVNDRQFLEFVKDDDPESKGFLESVSFECDNLAEMKAYLESKDILVTKGVGSDGAGNQTMEIAGTETYHIEFICFGKEGLHRKSKGRYLGENRISHRIHHAGLYISDIDKADQLYRKIFGFEEIWSYKPVDASYVKFVYLRIPDCVENIEYCLAPNSSHPCFLVEDMQQTIYDLKERQGDNSLAKPMIGRGNRWLLNMTNNDGARVEFTEAFTAR